MSSCCVDWFEVPKTYDFYFAIHSSKAFPISPVASIEKEKSVWVFVEHLVGPLLPGSVCFYLFPWLLRHFLSFLPDDFLLLHSGAVALLPACPLSWFPLGAVGSLLGLVLIQMECPPTMGFRQYRRSPVTAGHSLPMSLMT
jgi:hypothetical protein